MDDRLVQIKELLGTVLKDTDSTSERYATLREAYKSVCYAIYLKSLEY